MTFTTTNATGCANPQFEFWLRSPNGTWTMKRGFADSPAWVWDTSTYAAGTYVVHVWANQHGGLTNTYQAIGEMTASPWCKTATLTPAPVSQPAGSTIAFHAPTVPVPRYEYWVKLLNGKWYTKRGFSSDPTELEHRAYRRASITCTCGPTRRATRPRLEAMGSKVTLTGCTPTVSPAWVGRGGPRCRTATASGCPMPV